MSREEISEASRRYRQAITLYERKEKKHAAEQKAYREKIERLRIRWITMLETADAESTAADS